jgi:beta-lactamase class C
MHWQGEETRRPDLTLVRVIPAKDCNSTLRSALLIIHGTSLGRTPRAPSAQFRKFRRHLMQATLPNPPALVEQMIKPYMERTDTHGAAVAVYYKGKEYLLSFGDDGASPAKKITPDLLFGIGSVTKTFTAAMLAYQTTADVGKTPLKNINSCVCDYLPADVKEYGRGIRKVTLLELATHTASFPSRVPGHPGDQLYTGQPPSEDLTKWWQDFTKPPYPPEVLYSNVGYVTLGFALAGPNEKPSWNDLLARDITGPLKMSHTLTQPPSSMPIAQGYVGKASVEMDEADLKSNARDMLTWLEANIGALNKSISPHLAEALRVTHRIWFMTPPEDRFNMGLGWEVFSKEPSQTVIFSKNGASRRGGYSCWVGFMPDDKIGVAILTNEFGAEHDTELGILQETPTGDAMNPAELGRQLITRLDGGSIAPPPKRPPSLGERLKRFMFDTED